MPFNRVLAISAFCGFHRPVHHNVLHVRYIGKTLVLEQYFYLVCFVLSDGFEKYLFVCHGNFLPFLWTIHIDNREKNCVWTVLLRVYDLVFGILVSLSNEFENVVFCVDHVCKNIFSTQEIWNPSESCGVDTLLPEGPVLYSPVQGVVIQWAVCMKRRNPSHGELWRFSTWQFQLDVSGGGWHCKYSLALAEIVYK